MAGWYIFFTGRLKPDIGTLVMPGREVLTIWRYRTQVLSTTSTTSGTRTLVLSALVIMRFGSHERVE